ncbi:conserved hypothetical protein [Neospora caninum Liverpool]|uniref:Uncharacterized protein n=1 Tax=Neospora caninum (strain Liverpool) TaxID=572307 RepID=F0VJM4_NEOCL|nr:conserved hypothetical protein [Neospora caninum Liverpool]CBZ53935.1 conserved hypothetical protein [Neospora caninum Liverpool]CEL67933.1 TPA: hypothetical protein BN1204_037170 [Neospora caninum Liverpool]|eukprot:XP_003883967.1 conserved hypothetical protein [Neospora caninum Liverpool]
MDPRVWPLEAAPTGLADAPRRSAPFPTRHDAALFSAPDRDRQLWGEGLGQGTRELFVPQSRGSPLDENRSRRRKSSLLSTAAVGTMPAAAPASFCTTRPARHESARCRYPTSSVFASGETLARPAALYLSALDFVEKPRMCAATARGDQRCTGAERGFPSLVPAAHGVEATQRLSPEVSPFAVSGAPDASRRAAACRSCSSVASPLQPFPLAVALRAAPRAAVGTSTPRPSLSARSLTQPGERLLSGKHGRMHALATPRRTAAPTLPESASRFASVSSRPSPEASAVLWPRASSFVSVSPGQSPSFFACSTPHACGLSAAPPNSGQMPRAVPAPLSRAACLCASPAASAAVGGRSPPGQRGRDCVSRRSSNVLSTSSADASPAAGRSSGSRTESPAAAPSQRAEDRGAGATHRVAKQPPNLARLLGSIGQHASVEAGPLRSSRRSEASPSLRKTATDPHRSTPSGQKEREREQGKEGSLTSPPAAAQVAKLEKSGAATPAIPAVPLSPLAPEGPSALYPGVPASSRKSLALREPQPGTSASVRDLRGAPLGEAGRASQRGEGGLCGERETDAGCEQCAVLLQTLVHTADRMQRQMEDVECKVQHLQEVAERSKRTSPLAFASSMRAGAQSEMGEDARAALGTAQARQEPSQPLVASLASPERGTRQRGGDVALGAGEACHDGELTREKGDTGDEKGRDVRQGGSSEAVERDLAALAPSRPEEDSIVARLTREKQEALAERDFLREECTTLRYSVEVLSQIRLLLEERVARLERAVLGAAKAQDASVDGANGDRCPREAGEAERRSLAKVPKKAHGLERTGEGQTQTKSDGQVASAWTGRQQPPQAEAPWDPETRCMQRPVPVGSEDDFGPREKPERPGSLQAREAWTDAQRSDACTRTREPSKTSARRASDDRLVEADSEETAETARSVVSKETPTAEPRQDEARVVGAAFNAQTGHELRGLQASRASLGHDGIWSPKWPAERDRGEDANEREADGAPASEAQRPLRLLPGPSAELRLGSQPREQNRSSFAAPEGTASENRTSRLRSPVYLSTLVSSSGFAEASSSTDSSTFPGASRSSLPSSSSSSSSASSSPSASSSSSYSSSSSSSSSSSFAASAVSSASSAAGGMRPALLLTSVGPLEETSEFESLFAPPRPLGDSARASPPRWALRESPGELGETAAFKHDTRPLSFASFSSSSLSPRAVHATTCLEPGHRETCRERQPERRPQAPRGSDESERAGKEQGRDELDGLRRTERMQRTPETCEPSSLASFPSSSSTRPPSTRATDNERAAPPEPPVRVLREALSAARQEDQFRGTPRREELDGEGRRRGERAGKLLSLSSAESCTETLGAHLALQPSSPASRPQMEQRLSSPRADRAPPQEGTERGGVRQERGAQRDPNGRNVSQAGDRVRCHSGVPHIHRSGGWEAAGETGTQPLSRTFPGNSQTGGRPGRERFLKANTERKETGGGLLQGFEPRSRDLSPDLPTFSTRLRRSAVGVDSGTPPGVGFSRLAIRSVHVSPSLSPSSLSSLSSSLSSLSSSLSVPLVSALLEDAAPATRSS